MKGIKRRTLDRQPRRAVPMTVEVLSRLNAFLYSGSSLLYISAPFDLICNFSFLIGDRSIRVWRTVWRVNVMFRCLLRWDDIHRLRVSLLIL